MFENFENAKVIKRRTWASMLLTISVVVHGVLFAALLIRSFWMIKQLEPPKRESTLAVAPPPPPPPKGNPGHKMKDQPKEIKPKKHKITETVQPVKVEPKLEDPSQNDSNDDPNATPDGDENSTGGIDTGVNTEAPPPPPPPPPPPTAPTIVAAQMLQGNRISGDPQIHPDESTEIEISRSGKTRLITSAKLCLDKAGNISSVSLVKSSGFPAYDDKIRREMNTWRYKPWTVNGQAVPVCTAITFIYSVQH
jgi:TonB family protein